MTATNRFSLYYRMLLLIAVCTTSVLSYTIHQGCLGLLLAWDTLVTIQLVIQRCWLSVICVKSRFIPLIFSAVCKQEHTCALYGHSIDSVDLDHQLDTWPFGVIARGTVVWFPSARMLLYICYVNIFDLCRYYTRWKVMSC